MGEAFGRDHRYHKGRLCPSGGFGTLTGARVPCAGPAFLRNPRGHFDQFPWSFGAAPAPKRSAMARAWDGLATTLPTR